MTYFPFTINLILDTTIREAVILVLQMRGDRLRLHDIRIKFNDDKFRYLSNIMGIT
jgi:hypothetical protein